MGWITEPLKMVVNFQFCLTQLEVAWLRMTEPELLLVLALLMVLVSMLKSKITVPSMCSMVASDLSLFSGPEGVLS
jgi:hypothetical protein